MTQITEPRLSARVQHSLGEGRHLLLAALAAQSLRNTGQTAAERRACLALRIALCRMAAIPAAIPVTPPAILPQDLAAETGSQTAPEPPEIPAITEILPPDPTPPAPVGKPRKPARVTMSSVRLEDAALLLDAAFADTSDTNAAHAPPPSQG